MKKLIHSSARVSAFRPAIAGNKKRERLQRLAELLNTVREKRPQHPLTYAGRDPWFRRRGLRTVRDVISGKTTVVFRGQSGWTAAKDFFSLIDIQAQLLFSRHMTEAKSGLELSRRIDRFLKKLVT